MPRDPQRAGEPGRADAAGAVVAKLGAGMTALGLGLASPVEANEVFVAMPPEVYRRLWHTYAVHQPDPGVAVVRFVCSWATTDVEVEAVLATVGELV